MQQNAAICNTKKGHSAQQPSPPRWMQQNAAMCNTKKALGPATQPIAADATESNNLQHLKNAFCPELHRPLERMQRFAIICNTWDNSAEMVPLAAANAAEGNWLQY